MAAALVGVLLSGGACTGDKSDGNKPDEHSGPVVQEVPLTAKVGVVTGKLQPARRTAMADRVGELVGAWFDAAYLAGDYPRTSFGDSFPGFTRKAAVLASRDQDLLSNAAIGSRIDGVVPLRKTVRVDLLSPGRHPAGATARFRLEFATTGTLQRTVVVNGRLMLVKVHGAWKIFAYDVKRSVRAAEGGAQ